MRILFTILSTLVLSACAGKIDYIRPTTEPQSGANTKVVDRPRDSVWATSVPELSKQFFVINNLDKVSGLINISYGGDPQRYIDCGRITSYVKNARGERAYDFPGAIAQQAYEVMYPNGLFFIDRRMNIEGRVNVIFEDIEANRTKITVNTRYVVTRSQTIRSAANSGTQTGTDTISFNTGGRASFPANPQGQYPECIATGALETELLSAIR